MTNSQRDANGRFGPGNPGNPRPHNVLTAEEKAFADSIDKEVAEALRLNPTFQRLIQARTPALMVKAFDQAERDDSVVGPLLALLAEQQRARNIAAEAQLMTSGSTQTSTH
ncbi:hypothetical protein [Methylobacterium sp. 22177]|uniref:hypothetical protein n=1 Tax=Methylobacterium sp. 22177 TaxID=3453885 RepID=UPI003F82C480